MNGKSFDKQEAQLFKKRFRQSGVGKDNAESFSNRCEWSVSAGVSVHISVKLFFIVFNRIFILSILHAINLACVAG